MMKKIKMTPGRRHKIFRRSSVLLAFMMSFQFASVAFAESKDSLMKKAVEEYRKGNFEDASGHFYATLSTDFSNAVVHYYMASCYVHLKDHESAVREFRIAYALAPDSDVGYYAKTALKYFRMKPDGTSIGMTKQLDPSAPPSKDEDAKKSATSSSASSTGASSATSVTSKSADLIQTQAQKEKNSRLEQSQKLADQINQQGEDRVNKTITAAGGSATSNAKDREQQMLRMPDDVKTMLSRLKSDYDTQRDRQLNAGRDQAAKLDESAANLQSLIDQHQSIDAAGSNLYVRNYKKNPPTQNAAGSATKN